MVKSEILKLFQRLSTRIILLVLLAANGFLVWNQQLPGAEQYYKFDASHILSLYSALPDDAASALKALGQQAFNEHYPDKDFMKIFGKNYI